MSGLRTLSQLVRDAGVSPRALSGGDPPVRGVSLDSRTVSAGDLFLALQGQRAPGTRFVPQALERGAVAVLAGLPRPAGLDPQVGWVEVSDDRRDAGLVSRETFGRPDEALTLVGITGTNGKTTVSYLVESIASAAGLAAGRIGTTGWRFGGEERPLDRTTPEAPEFYRLLARMREAGVELVALEVSSHALALSRVAGARFRVAAFLNLTRDHLDFHGSEENYFEAKASLFDGLDARRCAVLPCGELGDRIAERTAAKVIRFGSAAGAEIRVREAHCSLAGTRAELETPDGVLKIETPLTGRFNVDNVAAAVACAWACEIPAEAIERGVAEIGSIPGRMERVVRGQPFDVIVDYAHTADALRRLLAGVRELSDGRIAVVFGCGGERDRGKRPEMGRAAAEGADRVWLTSDNPRGEDPQTILNEIAAAVGDSAVERIVDRAEAIDRAIGDAAPGDVVVVAGKGHEATQEIGGEKLPLDDRALVCAALARRGWDEDGRGGA